MGRGRCTWGTTYQGTVGLGPGESNGTGRRLLGSQTNTSVHRSGVPSWQTCQPSSWVRWNVQVPASIVQNEPALGEPGAPLQQARPGRVRVDSSGQAAALARRC